MKYAEIRKDGRSWEMLVGFPDIVTRAEQWMRYGYEYPNGTWENLSWADTRMRGWDVRRFKRCPIMVEMCNGQVYPAIVDSIHMHDIVVAKAFSVDPERYADAYRQTCECMLEEMEVCDEGHPQA